MHYGISIKLYEQEKFFGPGVARLLRLVEQKASLRKAVAEMNMAYSKAWRMIKTAEDALGFALLATQTGGKNGGGASLTPEAQAFLEKYDAFCQKIIAAADGLYAQYFGGE